jgi:hypothetical protein
VKMETFKKHLLQSHNIEFTEAIHGYKGSFEEILKTGRAPKPAIEREVFSDENTSAANADDVTHDMEAEFVCYVCDKILNTYRLLKDHRAEHHQVLINRVCNLCSEQTDKGYMKHVVEKHRDYKPQSCRLCSKKFQLACQLKNHLFNHVDGKKFKCFGCGVSCSNLPKFIYYFYFIINPSRFLIIRNCTGPSGTHS